MMTPQCPDHGNQLRDLLLGRLDEAQAAQAEELSERCEHCAAWWNQAASDAQIRVVDEAVAEAFNTVELAQQRRRMGPLWAVAAAAVLALGVSALWHSAPKARHDVARGSAKDAGQAIAIIDFEHGADMTVQNPDKVIARFDFEQGSMTGQIPRT